MFKIIKGDIDNLQHVYENGRGTNHYIKITNDISSFNFMQGTVANDLSSSAVKVAQIGDNVIELQDKCFYNCTALSGVNSSTNLKQLGSQCFENCTSLTYVDALMTGSLDSIGTQCFCNTGFESLTLNFKSASIAVGQFAFANCKSLQQVVFTNTTYLSPFMFSGCTSLALCQPGSSCRNIGQYAFSGCSSLQAFKVPNSMSEIPEGFFNGCTSLAICDFDSFTGSMLQKVSNFAFSGCSNLQSLTLPTSINSISKISNLAFSGSSLTQITFKGLSDSAFEGGSADTGRRYSTGRLYSNTAEGYSVIDEALETNTPVVVIIGNSAHNGAKGSGVFQMIAYSSAFTGAIAMKPYYFVYIDKQDNSSGYDYVLSHPTLGELFKPYYNAVKDVSMIKMESGKNNRKETYANEQWPFVITIWNKTATQAGGQDLAGIYYAKIQNNTKPATCAKPFSLTVSAASRDDTKLEEAIQQVVEYIGGLLDKSYVAPTEAESESISTSITGWGLDHDCIFISSSGKEYKFTVGGGSGEVEPSSGIQVDTTTTTGFKFGKWYGNVVELAQYFENVNLSGYNYATEPIAKPKEVPLEQRVGLVIVATSSERSDGGSDDYSMFYNYIFSSSQFQNAMLSSACLLGYYEGDNWSGVKTQILKTSRQGGALQYSLMSNKDPSRPCIIYPSNWKFLTNLNTTRTSNSYFKYIYYSGFDIAVDKNACSNSVRTGTSSTLKPEIVLSAMPNGVVNIYGTGVSDKERKSLIQSSRPLYQ